MPTTDNATFNLLQQQLIDTRDRLDRQLVQLRRLNQLSTDLLGAPGDVPLGPTFAEALVDVLDAEVGAVWLCPTPAGEPGRPTVVGMEASEADLRALGDRIAELLPARGALRIPPDVVPRLGFAFQEVIACRCVGRDGETTAILLVGNTATGMPRFEPLDDDRLAVVAALAEKCAAMVDHAADRRVIHEQLEAIRDSEDRLTLVLDGTHEGWWDWNIGQGRCFYSPRWWQMIGVEGTQPEYGPFWADRVAPADRPAFDARLAAALARGEALEVEIGIRRDDGVHLPVLVRGVVRRDAEGRPTRFAGSVQDLTERKRHEEEVQRLAFFDPLTELPNRRLLADRLEQALRVRGRTGQGVAVLTLDLDRFKALNDAHGHAAGDQLLRAVARRLLENVRRHDTVARIGGDEYVVVLDHLGTDAALALRRAEHISRKLLAAINQPYALDVGIHHHGASIGVALADENSTGQALLEQADLALYQAKQSGRNTARVYDPELRERAATRLALESRLRSALEQEDLQLYFQAQVDAAGRLIGAEALARWMPSGGVPIPPSQFIPIAEECGLIHAIGQYNLLRACRQLVRWQERLAPGFRLAVNVSAQEFLHPQFADRMITTLRDTGAPGHFLKLELTEATVLTETDLAAHRMRQLREHAVEFSLDDFGTGYSSLSHLRRLPVSEVKIDRSFVSRLGRDEHDEAIVRGILALCGALDVRVVAEGIETAEQAARLREHGCRGFQGYFFGMPRPAPADPGALLGG